MTELNKRNKATGLKNIKEICTQQLHSVTVAEVNVR
jgi:hypothetical protein